MPSQYPAGTAPPPNRAAMSAATLEILFDPPLGGSPILQGSSPAPEGLALDEPVLGTLDEKTRFPSFRTGAGSGLGIAEEGLPGTARGKHESGRGSAARVRQADVRGILASTAGVRFPVRRTPEDYADPARRAEASARPGAFRSLHQYRADGLDVTGRGRQPCTSSAPRASGCSFASGIQSPDESTSVVSKPPAASAPPRPRCRPPPEERALSGSGRPTAEDPRLPSLAGDGGCSTRLPGIKKVRRDCACSSAG